MIRRRFSRFTSLLLMVFFLTMLVPPGVLAETTDQASPAAAVSSQPVGTETVTDSTYSAPSAVETPIIPSGSSTSPSSATADTVLSMNPSSSVAEPSAPSTPPADQPAPSIAQPALAQPELLSMGSINLGCQLSDPAELAAHTAQRSPLRAMAMSMAALPASVDWTPDLPQPGDQKSQSSCVAWAVGYANKSFVEQIQHRWGVNTVKHQFSPSYIYNQVNYGINVGTTVAQALNLLVQQGCDTLDSCPYVESDYLSQPTQAQRDRAAIFKIQNWTSLPVGTSYNQTQVKEALTRGPIIFTVPVHGCWGWIVYGDISLKDTGTYGVRGCHAICVVGYDDSKVTEDGVGAFKFINSWGPNWGHGGYGYISYEWVQQHVAEIFTINDLGGDNYSISGSVYQNNAALSGVTLTCQTISGNAPVPAPAVTDGNGAWTQSGLMVDSRFRITPSKSGYTFSPSFIEFSFDELQQTSFMFQAVPPANSITITKPVIGETWCPGGGQAVQWTTTGNPGLLKIELLKAGAVVTVFADNIPAENHYYMCPLSPNLELGDDYQVRISSQADASCTCTSPFFSVKAPVLMHLASPAKDQVCYEGSPQTIRWVTATELGNIRIELYKAGAFHSAVASDVDSHLGTFSWLIPTSLVPATDYQLAFFAQDNRLLLKSDCFTIHPSIRITRPSQSDPIPAGSMLHVQWQYAGYPDSFRLDLLKGGIPFTLLYYEVPGEYEAANWPLPSDFPIGTDYQVRISSVTDPTIQFISDMFTIGAPATAYITTPLRFTSWQPGATKTVEWYFSGNTEQLRLDLMNNATGQFVSTLAAVPASNGFGSCSITMPADLAWGWYSLRLSSNSVSGSCQTSGDPFMVVPVSLTAPASGQNIVMGSTAQIQWSYAGTPNLLRIDLNNANGFVQTIARNIPGDQGNYLWNVPTNLQENRYFLSFVTEDGNQPASYKCAGFNIWSDHATVTITSPRAGNSRFTNASLLVLWQCTGLPGEFQLDLYKSGTLVKTVDSHVYAYDGLYRWILPDNLPEGNDYQVRLTSTSDYSCSAFSENFGIWKPAAITITSPSLIEVWQQGSSHAITWKYSGTPGPIQAEVYSNGQYQRTLAMGIPVGTNGLGSYTWNIPADFPNGQYEVRLTSNSLYGTTIEAVTPSILLSQLAVTSPARYTILYRGQVASIRWNFVGNPINMRIEIARPPVFGQIGTLIADNVPSWQGSYAWRVPSDMFIASDYELRFYDKALNTGPVFTVPYPISIQQPQNTLELTSPANGTSWVQGSQQLIQWKYSGNPGPIKIELARSIAPVMTIAEGINPADRQFSWQVPTSLVPGTDYKIRISSISDPGCAVTKDITILSPTAITFTAPSASETWLLGTAHTIKWTYKGPANAFTLDLMKDGAVYQTIYADVPITTAGSASQYWIVPTTLPLGVYQLRASCAGGTASSKYILVTNLLITAPANGTTWKLGSAQVIRWRYSGTAVNLSVTLLKSGIPLQVIVPSIPGRTGYYNLTVPASLAPGTDYQFQIANSATGALLWTSGNFSLQPAAGTVTITRPLTSEPLVPGSQLTVGWTYTGLPGYFKIEMIKGDAEPVVIAPQVAASAKQYTYTIPQSQALGNDYQVRLTSTVDPDCSGISQTFTIGSPAAIAISAPTAGAVVQQGKPVSVAWTYTGQPEDFTLDLMNGSVVAATYAGIPANGTGSGSFDWMIPSDVPNGNYKLRLTCSDLAASGTATSNAFNVSQVLLISPTELDSWDLGTYQYVQWTSVGNRTYFSLDLMRNGTRVAVIAQGISSTDQSAFRWFVPANLTPGSGYQIRLNCNENGSVAYAGPMFTIAQQPATLTITSPLVNQWGTVNNPFTINWNYTGNPGSLRIDLLKGDTMVTTAVYSQAFSVGGAGSFNWRLPVDLRSGNDYRIRITSNLEPICTATSSYFNIANPVTIKFTSPPTGETWLPGSTHTFRWTYTGSPEPFRIDLINAQKVATTIAENVYAGASGVGSYDWAIPMNLAKGSYRMRLTYTDSGLVRTCETNGFSVSPVIFTTPAKTTTWQKGVPQTITWTAGGPPMNIRIYLLKSGTTIASITLNVPAAQGTFQYTPPSTLAAGTDYRVKATDDRGIGIIYSPYFAVN